MGFFDLFRRGRLKKTTSTWQEFGSYQSIFSTFGSDIYTTSIVRSCIRPLAEITSKAEIKVTADAQLERLMNYRPNLYMNGREFLKKVRIMYEVQGNVFIYIMRDNANKVVGLYPIPYQAFTAVENNGRLFITFQFANASAGTMTAAWDDLAVLRKDYYKSDIAGESNNAIIQNLDLVNTTNQGLANAVKATANLRGILKNTKAMLADEDIKKRQQEFVKNYMNLENEGGIASLDATQEFTPITMSPVVTTYTQMKEIRENVYRYFGVNNEIMQGIMTPEQLEAFCEAKVLPFLADLSTELTSKIYLGKALAYEKNEIIIHINKLQFASTSTKLAMTALVDRGAMTPNEWRRLFGLNPIEGGDDVIRRLDTAAVDEQGNNNTPDTEESNTAHSDDAQGINNDEEGE